MSVAEAVQTTSKASSSSSSGFVLQRKCACGGSAGFTGECEECRRKKFLGKPLQRTLAINEPDDEHEREADRVAEQVMRIAEPPRRSSGADPQASSLVQGRVGGAAAGGAGTAPPLVQEVLASPGQSPDASARAFLEPRFGQSLDDVRLHTDGRAQQAAKSVHARAFTVGRHIVFGAGEYVPHSVTSTLLLAHELTHVVQQTGGASVLARKSSEAVALDESVVAVAEPVAGDEVESAVDVAGASSRGELGRLSAALPDEQREEEGEAVQVEERPLPQSVPAGLSERSETSATLEEAAVAPSAATHAEGVAIGTPSETGRQFNAPAAFGPGRDLHAARHGVERVVCEPGSRDSGRHPGTNGVARWRSGTAGHSGGRYSAADAVSGRTGVRQHTGASRTDPEGPCADAGEPADIADIAGGRTRGSR